MKYVCQACGFVYDEDLGDPNKGIKPGTKFEDLPDDYVCDWCGAIQCIELRAAPVAFELGDHARRNAAAFREFGDAHRLAFAEFAQDPEVADGRGSFGGGGFGFHFDGPSSQIAPVRKSRQTSSNQPSLAGIGRHFSHTRRISPGFSHSAVRV